MSLYEGRAWLALWSLCPPYVIYFAFQLGFPNELTTMWQRIGALAAAAGMHALLTALGFAWLWMRRDRDDTFRADERDLAIDARASRGAYYLLLFGAITFGMVLPFKDSGWKIVNAAVLFIVLSEALRNILIVRGYREPPRHAR